MKAAYIEQTGSPDVIQYGDMPEPAPGPGQVRIRVEAVSVNPIDTYVRSGVVAFQLPQPFIIGCDAAGTIDAVGVGVDRFAVGDRVWCTNQGLLGRQGTFAEQIVIDASWCFRRSDSVSAEDAAATALVGMTAHLGLFREAGHLFNQPGRAPTIAVIGGSGGVGSMVVQMAKVSGARVIATAGSDAKCELAKQFGADEVIQYHNESIVDGLTRLAPEGVDLFWETRREPDFDVAIASLRERGTMILMAGRDARPTFPVGPFYVKECSLRGFVMFKASSEEMQRAAIDIDRWLASADIRANISHRFALSDAVEAHQLQEAGTLRGEQNFFGKIVLHP